MPKPILCLDFDGVVHSYISPWIDEVTISDPPVPGAIAWMLEASKFFTVIIYSTRSKTEQGRTAMRNYIEIHAADEFPQWEQVQQLMTALIFANEKPPAFLTIDDRAMEFNGDWASYDPQHLLTFKPWNKR